MSVASKMPCAVSREEFRQGAQPVPVKLGEVPLTADPKEFSTGSFGFYCGGKVTLTIGGKAVPCQVGINVTVINSKDAPATAALAPAA